jgi:hypothetical protein
MTLRQKTAREGLEISVGAMLNDIGHALREVIDGRFRSALAHQLGAHVWALWASDWAERLERYEAPAAEEAPAP